MTLCTKLALKNGFYDGLLLIDEQGRRLNVTGAKKVRMVPPKLTIGNILDFISGNPRYEVELMFTPGPPATISLAEARKLILDSFRKERHSWEAMADFEEFRDKIAAATSLEQILNVFREYHV